MQSPKRDISGGGFTPYSYFPAPYYGMIMRTIPIPSSLIQQGINPVFGFSLEILSNRKPYMVAVYDGGGLEVAGHIVSPWWANLGAWARLLINRNTHGLLPFDNSPEPWPNYYLGILEAERSHLEVPWPLDCDQDEPLFKNYPIALRQFSPRDWRRITILKFGGNPCR